jgi:Raf kinase inhibitor-like YbhB/YbcL family protein
MLSIAIRQRLWLMCVCFLLSMSILGVGCSPAATPALQGGKVAVLQVSSTAFDEGAAIPGRYTCDGDGLSPPISWSGAPEGVESLALIVDDPDAPVGVWVHWTVYDIPASRYGLPEGVAKDQILDGIGMQGVSGFGEIGYGGPCPPPGDPHRYFFKLYALDTRLDLKPGASKADVEKAMQGHILAEGQLMGIYGR